MNPDQWQQIDDLFHAALERGTEGRAAWLATACQGDDELQHKVARLLAAHHEDDDEVWTASPAALAAQWLNEQPSSAQSVPPTLIGQQLGHYKIEALLGKGGTGEVWRAQDTHLNRAVALKVLPAEFAHNADRLRRFKQEAQAISALNHPNIITIFEIGQAADLHFISTELLDGESLPARLQRSPLPLGEALEIAVQIATALEAAHAAEIMHRDIKPENIMLRRDCLVKVLDFGLAKLLAKDEGGGMKDEKSQDSQLHPSSPSTIPGMVMGTVHYLSPEQARGMEVDTRSDIFSLGVVLYEMVAGRKPFAGKTISHTIVAILETEPPPLAHYSQEVPPELERIVKQALVKDRAARYQTAHALLRDLKALRHELEFEAQPERARAAAAASHEAVTAILRPQETNENQALRTISSAQIIVSEIKRTNSA